jgi:predicted component of type VI protein secretion system
VKSLSEYLSNAQDEAQAKWAKVTESETRLAAVRGVMDQLTQMGDMVTPEDVVKGAGRIVAAGMSASAVAGLLADMPEQPQALQAWVAQQDQGVRQREAQLQQVKASVGHELGVKSLKLLMGLGAEQKMQQSEASGNTAGPMNSNMLMEPNNAD